VEFIIVRGLGFSFVEQRLSALSGGRAIGRGLNVLSGGRAFGRERRHRRASGRAPAVIVVVIVDRVAFLSREDGDRNHRAIQISYHLLGEDVKRTLVAFRDPAQGNSENEKIIGSKTFNYCSRGRVAGPAEFETFFGNWPRQGDRARITKTPPDWSGPERGYAGRSGPLRPAPRSARVCAAAAAARACRSCTGGTENGDDARDAR
jgi:hypothetical protein